MQGDSTTLHGGTFNSGIRKNFFIGRMVKRWSRLLGTRPRPTGTETVDVVLGDYSSAGGGWARWSWKSLPSESMLRSHSGR